MSRLWLTQDDQVLGNHSTSDKLSLFSGVSALIVVLTCAALPIQARVKKDIVVMKNGDTMTGEVKSLVNGLLAFQADYMAATVQLDWNKIATIKV